MDEELRTSFLEAVEHMATTKADISEEAQRRLFGLFHRAQASSSSKTAGMQAEQKAAIDAVGTLTEAQAMREYIELVERSDESFLFEADDDGENNREEQPPEMPPEILAQLAAAGFTQAGAEKLPPSAAEGSSVFDAAREGADLSPFLAAGATAVDEDGLTALHHAIDAEQPHAAMALLAAKADPNARDADGSTPLHYAALLGSTDLATILRNAGADPTARDDDGQSAVQVATAQGHGSLAEQLAAAPAPSKAAASTSAASTSAASISAAAAASMQLVNCVDCHAYLLGIKVLAVAHAAQWHDPNHWRALSA